MIKRFLILILLVNISFCANAQKDFEYIDSSLNPVATDVEAPGAPPEDIVTVDTSVNIRPVIFPQDTVNFWKAKSEFRYLRNLDSLLRDKQSKEQRQKPMASNTSSNYLESILRSSVLQMLLWVIAIAVVVYILYQLFLSKAMFSRKSNNKIVKEIDTEDEMFLQQNFDELIHQSYKLENYRASTRYLFLKALKQLSDKNYIVFAIDKTNSKYVKELPADKQAAFSKLVLNYEYVWYGNTKIERSQFSAIESKFISFYENI